MILPNWIIEGLKHVNSKSIHPQESTPLRYHPSNEPLETVTNAPQVPSSSPKFLQKSQSLRVDSVAYDLEDSVTTSQKPAARQNILSFLSDSPRPAHIGEVGVRINSVSSGLALEDLQVVLGAKNLDALIVPKVNKASDLHFITDVLQHVLPGRHPSSTSATTIESNPIKILALIESAESLTNLNAICKASPYLSGLIFAAEDFALDLSLTRTPGLSEFLYARSAIATEARAHNLPSTIDLVCTKFRGEEGLRTLEEECVGGRGLGFNGKQCIHPSQVEVAQKAFAPADDEVEWAVRVMIGDAKADAGGRGAWTLEGKMIDVPVVGKAKAIVKKARRCGIDVDAIKEKWKDQEPE